MPCGIVDVRGVPLAEAVGADVLITEVVTDGLQILLYRPLRNREESLRGFNAVLRCVLAEVIVDALGDGERPFLPGLRFHNVEPVPTTITDEVGESETQNVTYTHSEVRFSGEYRHDPGVRSE